MTEPSSTNVRRASEATGTVEQFLEFASRTLSELNDLPPEGDLFAFIGRTLADIAPEETIILVNSLDQEERTITLRTVVGLGSRKKIVEAILGRPLVGLSFQVPDSVITSMLTGECEEIRGLKELTFGWIPDSIGALLEALPFFGKIYSVGISWKGKLNGAVTFILPPGASLTHRGLITFFVRQAAGHLQRRRAEESAREHAELYRTLAESAQDLIAICDSDGTIRYLNPYGAALMGRTPPELIGAGLEQLFPSALAGDVVRLLAVSRDTGTGVTADLAVPLSAGEAYFDARIIPLPNAQGEIRECMIAARNITARITAEEAVRESEQRFVKVFQGAPLPLTLVSAADRAFIDVNPAFLRESGYTRDDVIGRTPEALGIFPDPRDYDWMVSCLRDTGRVQDVELQVRIKSGEIRSCLFSSSIVMMHGMPYVLSAALDITERKRAESALRESQGQLVLALSASDVGIFTWDLVTNERNVITGSGLLFGYTEAELAEIFRHFEDFAHPDDPGNPTVIRDSIDAHGRRIPGEFERRIRGKNGEWQWMLIRGSVVRTDPAGAPLEVTGTFRDITAQRQAKEALTQANAALQKQSATLSTLNSVIIAANLSRDLPSLFDRILVETLTLLDYDAGAVSIVDRAAGTATVVASRNLPSGFLETVETVSIEQPPYDALFVRGRPIVTDRYEAISPDLAGQTGFRSLASVPLVSRYRVIGALTVMSRRRDLVTEGEREILAAIGRELGTTIERVSAEEDAQRSSTNLTTLFDSIDELVFILDLNGRAITFNRAVRDRLQYTEEELVGRDVLSLHAPEEREEALRIFQGLIDGTIDSCSLAVLAKDGTRIEAETKITRGWWDNREVIIGVTRDVTERKRTDDALRRANRQLGLLTAVTRHDILNQVTVIRGYSTLAALAVSESPDVRPFLDGVKSATRSIQSQIEFTRLYQDIGAREPLWQNADELLPRAQVPSGVTFVSELQGVRIHADAMIAKVFFNLLDNSIRHGRHVTAIRVSWSESDAGLTIFWHDNGTGVPAEEKERIFERGYGHNTGLGLYLVREILAITGMTIREAGVAGGGARFEIAVPHGGYRLNEGLSPSPALSGLERVPPPAETPRLWPRDDVHTPV